MKVYRYATKREIDNILNGKLDKIGHTFSKSKCNTHNYRNKIKYLHFFKKVDSIDKIKSLRKGSKDQYYICEYDIPMLVLMIGRGVGYYSPKGYKHGNATKHVEYIVPISNFKIEWLKNYILDDITSEEIKTIG